MLLFQKYVNKLMKIQNEPISQLPTGIIGKQVWRLRISHLYIPLFGHYRPEGARNWEFARISEIQWLVHVQS